MASHLDNPKHELHLKFLTCSENELWPATNQLTSFVIVVNLFVYYFYILKSLKNQKLYLGSTPNLRARLKSHNNGENKATKPNIPYELIFYSGFKSKEDAIECEQYFKTTAGWKRIHRMLENSLK